MKWISPRFVALGALVISPAFAQSADDVGDVDSYGRDRIFLGRANLLPISATETCVPNGLPTDQCVPLAAQPAQTVLDRPNLATLRLPARAANSVLCLDVIPNVAMIARNKTGAPAGRAMSVFLSVRVRNAALTGVNPNTGQPFNGEFSFLVGLMKDSGTMAANDDRSATQYAGQTCIVGGITKQLLRTTYGLSRQAADDFFNSQTTIGFGLSGSLKLVTTMLASIQVRAFGDAR